MAFLAGVFCRGRGASPHPMRCIRTRRPRWRARPLAARPAWAYIVGMETHSQPEHSAGPQAMPAAVRWTVLATLGLLVAGGLYLVSVRGEALLLDLSALSQRIFCF